MGRDLRARALRVDRLAHAGDDELVDPVLDVRRRVLAPEQPPIVRLVLAEQQLGRPVRAQNPVPELGMRSARRGDSCLAVDRLQCRLRDVAAPRPRVAEPQRRQEVQRRRVGTAIMGRDQHHDVISGRLRILHDHVEVPVLIEDPRVQQLVLHLLLAPAAVGLRQIRVRERPLRILVLALHVRVRRRAVQIEPVLLHILAVVPLRVREPEHPLLQDRVGSVPQRQRQAQPLPLVADPGDPVLPPVIRARPRLIVGEVIPRVPATAVVLAHSPPLALTEVRPPRLPQDFAGAGFL